MIFNSVRHITDKKEFLELIQLYIRIVEVMADENAGALDQNVLFTDDVYNELFDMGVIESREDVSILERELGSDYKKLVSSVRYYLNNKELFGDLLYKLSNKHRAELQSKTVAADQPVYADFFAGAGGLSCGFTQAGYRVCFANDNEEVCIRTYRYNHPELPSLKVVKEDIRRVVNSIEDYISEDVDIVVGGPPCQGFSSANQQRIIDDPRNELYKYYIEAVKRIVPKFVLMENVRGMLSVADQVVEDYRSIRAWKDGQEYSYDVSYRLLNSVDFGVAQSRERLIYIAVRDDVVASKGITPEDIFFKIESQCSNSVKVNLQSALEYIKPLEAPRIKGLTEVDDEMTGMKVAPNYYDSCGNDYLSIINGGKQIPVVFNHKARYCSDVNYEIFKKLEPGEDSTNPKIADIMPYAHRNGIFKDKYYKLYADRPCRTITAHLKMDCLSHIHPSQIRSITPREAARVQSFPDDYLFLGAYLKTYMQIGNAVPVLMAKQIATVIKNYI
ncbi:MAG: DNA cytosine methyltransferase [Prevotella sp.]|nr:DNA cytosine methyltransferase [Prevotella sp.]